MKIGYKPEVVDLVLKVFNEFVAHQFSQEDVLKFKKIVHTTALATRVNAVKTKFVLSVRGHAIIDDGKCTIRFL